MTNMSIQPLWLTHFIEILLDLEFQLTKFVVGTFSYKAHFRPQISSNESKVEVFNKFNEFKSLIENHTKKKIKIFRSKNGGELKSNEFKELCRDLGIKRELTTPYNPQQSGVAERKNITVMEAAMGNAK